MYRSFDLDTRSILNACHRLDPCGVVGIALADPWAVEYYLHAFRKHATTKNLSGIPTQSRNWELDGRHIAQPPGYLLIARSRRDAISGERVRTLAENRDFALVDLSNCPSAPPIVLWTREFPQPQGRIEACILAFSDGEIRLPIRTIAGQPRATEADCLTFESATDSVRHASCPRTADTAAVRVRRGVNSVRLTWIDRTSREGQVVRGESLPVHTSSLK
jgi:hypothetical protein